MAELNAYLKKRAAETGTTGLELHPGSEKDASKKPAGADSEWANPAQAETMPKSKAVVDVSLMNEKKKAEEDQKMTELSAPAATTDAGKKKPAKTGSKDIKFGAAAPRFIGSQTSEFPSMEEAKKMKKGPRKDKKAPAEKKEPEAAETKPSEPVVMPTKFTNTKKKEETPAFAKLEPAPEEKEHTHAVELTSVPYAAEKAPREFAIAGLEKPKEPHEHKPYYNKPRRHEWDEERESKKELGHGGKREQHGKGGFKKEYKKDKERFSEKRGDKKEEKKEEKKEKKVTKTGDAVAKFTTVAPTGGAVWTLDALNDK